MIVASAWNDAAVEPSRKERKTQDFSGRTRIDSSGPKWTRFNNSSTEAVEARLPTYTVRPVAFVVALKAALRALPG